MRVGLDLDGVVFQFDAGLRLYLVNECGWDAEDCPPAQTWRFYETWGLDTAGYLQACHDAVDAGLLWTTMPTYPGAVEAARRLYEVGHEVHVITARTFGTDPTASRRQTIARLAAENLPYDSITFSHDKTCVPVDVMIEDYPDNYLALQAAGVRAYLADRPWNAHLTGARRVAGVPEFAAEVMSLTVEQLAAA